MIGMTGQWACNALYRTNGQKRKTFIRAVLIGQKNRMPQAHKHDASLLLTSGI